MIDQPIAPEVAPDSASAQGGAARSFGIGGIGAILIACALFVVSDTLAKLLGGRLPVGEILLIRGALSLPVILPLVWRTGHVAYVLPALANRLIQARTLFEVTSTVFFVLGLVRIAYAEVIAVQQFTPLAVTAAAAIYLAEPVGWRRWLATLVGLLGVLIVIRPDLAVTASHAAGQIDDAPRWPMIFLIGCVVLIAARDVVTRRIGVAVPTMVVTLISVLAVGGSGLLLMPFERWVVPDGRELAMLAGTALASTGGYYWMAAGLRQGEASKVIPFRYSMVPYGVISSFAVFGEWPRPSTWIGLAIVLAAGTYTMHRERIRARERSREGARERTRERAPAAGDVVQVASRQMTTQAAAARPPS